VTESNSGRGGRAAKLLEAVAERLHPGLLPPEYAKLSVDDLRRLFREIARHVRTCPGWLAGERPQAGRHEKGVASLYADGASRGNPGPSGAGAVLLDEGDRRLVELSRFLGTATNNEAEYQGLIAGLMAAEDLGLTRLRIFLDSELVVKQLRGEYRVRNPRLQVLFKEVASLLQRLTSYAIMHVRRELNQEADRLANEAVDRGLRGGSIEEHCRAFRE
jgi:ribonuclease HI